MVEQEVEEDDECPICEDIMESCDKVGEREYCEVLIGKVARKEMNFDEFELKLQEKFGKGVKEMLEL